MNMSYLVLPDFFSIEGSTVSAHVTLTIKEFNHAEVVTGGHRSLLQEPTV